MGDAVLRKIRIGSAIAIGGAILTIVSGIAFMITYALGANVYAIGTAAALIFLGIAISFYSWATAVLKPARVIEDREVTPATTGQELELGRAFVESEAGLSRPKLFAALSATAATTLGLAALFPLRSLGARPAPSGKGEPWRAGVRVVDQNGRPIPRETLAIGGIATVFPEGGIDDPDASAVLIRLDANDPKLQIEGRDLMADGYVAFSKICTHVGCPVALYRKAAHQLLCPCHQSQFDVLRGAKVVGGPASRPLPQLALGFDSGGYLIARQGFDAPVGPARWPMPS